MSWGCGGGGHLALRVLDVEDGDESVVVPHGRERAQRVASTTLERPRYFLAI